MDQKLNKDQEIKDAGSKKIKDQKISNEDLGFRVSQCSARTTTQGVCCGARPSPVFFPNPPTQT